MATLEDKILGDDKRENYCSSSEDETDFDDALDGNQAESGNGTLQQDQAHFTRHEIDDWSGNSTNTGPKGVIKDWQRFKQLETERNIEKENERLALMKKLSLSAKTAEEDAQQAAQDEIDKELEELMNDDGILLQFQQQRMMEMMNRCGRKLKQFGRVHSFSTADEFLHGIDKEDPLVTVIVHIYENKLQACKTMNRCLDELAPTYVAVKFCKILGSVAGMSKNFKVTAVPALLVYKNGNLIGNFIRMTDDLGGDEFFPSDVESFLTEHAMLPDKSHMPTIVGQNNADDDDD